MKAQSKSLSTDASPRSLWLMGRSSDTKTGICSTSPDLYFSSLALGTNQHLAVLEKRSLQFPCMLLKLHLVQKHTRALFLVRDRGFERCSVLLNKDAAMQAIQSSSWSSCLGGNSTGGEENWSLTLLGLIYVSQAKDEGACGSTQFWHLFQIHPGSGPLPHTPVARSPKG